MLPTRNIAPITGSQTSDEPKSPCFKTIINGTAPAVPATSMRMK